VIHLATRLCGPRAGRFERRITPNWSLLTSTRDSSDYLICTPRLWRPPIAVTRGSLRRKLRRLCRCSDDVRRSDRGKDPRDGRRLSGEPAVLPVSRTQASVTGESMPVEKESGAAVYASIVNQSGALEEVVS
jgi:hypothetical protein